MATAENTTSTETGNQVVGSVVILYGNVKAISPDGTERLLSVNSPIFAHDRIITESDGRVSIVIDDDLHSQVDLGRMSDVVIDEDIYQGASPEEIAEATAEVEQIQEALLAEGFDPTTELEAPAAGGEDSAGGGIIVPDFARVTHEGNPTSGAETIGIAFDTVDPITGMFINSPPVINEDPQVSDLSARVSEEGLDDGIADTTPTGDDDTTNLTTANGQIIFSDADTTDTHVVSLTAPTEALTSDGNAITWDDTDPHTLIGSADGETIITITIDNAGNYSVDLDGRIDHGDNTAEDVESFGVTVTVDDQNGGIDTATLTIGIEDDMPVVSDDTGSIGEDDGATEIITISPAVFGADGPADTDSVSVVTDVDQGTLTYDPDTGTFSYDPGDAYNYLSAGETATETFTYQVTDDDGDTDTATVTITINGDNEPPVINEDPQVSDLSARVSEEGLDDGIADTDPGAPADTTDSDTATGQIIFSDADTTDTHLVSLTAPAEVLTSNGNTIIWDDTDPHNLIGSADDGEVVRVTIDDQGNYDVTLSARIDHGDDTVEDVESFGVTVTVDDQNGGIDTATLTIGIEDDKPVVSDDTGSIGEDDGATEIITISPAVFGADGPADTDSVSVVTDVDQGTLTYDPDTATFSYDPGDAYNYLAAGETATETFTYQVTDDDGDTDTATVTITINGDNEPPVINEDPEVSDLSARVSEEGLTDGIADTTPTGDDDTTNLTTANGQIIFSDADTTDTHLVSLTAPAEALTSDGNAITWDDTDPHTLIGSADGETIITITIDNAGNYSVDLDGRIDHGDNTAEDVESFGVTVTVDDQNGGIDTATLTIGIEDDKPVVSDDTGSIGEDDGATEIITISPAVFGADGPADTDSVSVVTDVDQGTLTYDPDTGTFSYDPGDAYNYLAAGETATETFTYQVTDDDGDTATATVTITINGDNEPPVINEDPEVSDLSARVSEEGLDDGIADTDPGAPADTTDSDTATGQIIFSDADTTDTHLVSLTAPAEVLTSNGNTIIWDDTDPHTLIGSADGETIITITIDNAGNYSVDLDGRIDHGDNTAEDVESFNITVTVTDPQGASDTATLTIGIEDDMPVVSDDTGSVGEDDGATDIITISPAVFGADGPADTDSVSVVTDVDQGTLTYDPDTGTFSYDPGDAYNYLAAGETATETFTYQVTDDDGDTDTATVTITINGDNEPPVINEDPEVSDLSARVSEEGLDDGIADTDPGAPADTTDSDTATGQIIFSDADTTDTHLVSLTAPAEVLTSNGNTIIWDDTDPHTLIGSADDGEVVRVTIDDQGNYDVTLSARIDHGDDTAEDVESFNITVTVTDPQGASDTATLTIGIEDDMPVVSDDTGSIGEDDGATEIITINPAVFGADGPADTDSVTVITDVNQGTLTYDPNTGTFSYDPGTAYNYLAAGEDATETFTYQVTDDDGDTDTATVTITINGDNEPPVINEDPEVSDLSARVSEEGLDDGIADTDPGAPADTTDSDTATGQIIFSDADTTDTHLVSLTAPAEVLTSNGNAITWDDTDPHTLIGSADGETIITITIDNAGNYSVDLDGRIDHGDNTAEDVESFGVTVTVDDQNGGIDTATLTIGIEDDKPVVSDDTASIGEDDGATEIITISPAVFGADGPADTDSVSVVTDVDQGTLTYDPDTATFSYDPGDAYNYLAAGETATETFTYQVTDDDGDTDTATVTITINGDNEPPVINEDPEVSDLSARVSEEGLDDGIADTTPTGDDDTTNLTTANGQIIFSDADTTDTHVISLTAPAEALTSDGNAITWDDTDPHTLIGSADGETIITITIDNAGNYSVDLDGRIDHGDNTAEDVESFGVTVTVDDQNGGIDTATLTIGIEDDMPLVSDDTGSIGEDDGATEIITISPAIFGADGPADTDSVSVVTDVNQGTLTYDPDTGTFSYDPGTAYNYLAAGETATETFTYQVTDDDGDTDTATVTITINGDNEPPVINEDPEVSDLSARVSEEGLDDGIADTDPGAPADTTDSDTATGQIIFSDADTTDTHLVSLTAPAEVLTSNGNTIIWDDTDPHTLIGSADGETIITITIDNAGNYSVDLDGRIDHGDNTAEDVESFGVTVTVDDQNGGIDTATLTIGIEDDKPVVSDDTASIGEDDGATEIITISPAVFGADGPADTDSVSVVTDVDQGTLTYDPDTATFSYDPGDAYNYLAAGETATETFTYQVTDDDGDTDTATVTITINGDNEPPVINEDPEVSDLSARVSEEGLDDGIADTTPTGDDDTTNLTTANGQIIFSDADTTDTHLVSLTAPAEVLTSNGNTIIWDDTDPHTLIGSADGETIITITIDNAGNYSVDLDGRIDHGDNTAEDVESFGVTVTVDDQNGGIDTATLTIGIEDDKPLVSDDTGSIGEDDGATDIITISPAVFGADGPADTDSVSVVTDVDQGTLTYDPDTGTFSYDPGDAYNYLSAGETATETFTYQVTDDDGDTATATVTITINGDNEPPVINEDPEVSDLSARVSEEGLDDGIADTDPGAPADTTDSDTATGQIIFSDADTTDTHLVSLTAPAEVLTSNGNTIIWDDTDPHTLIGSADGETIITITIDNAGNYSVDLDGRIDHGDNTAEDVESFNITVTVTDPQGASDTATLTIGIEDDMPVVSDDTGSIGEDDGATEIITINPAVFGADGPADTDSVTVITDVNQGTLTYDPNTGTFSYDPGTAYNYLAAGEDATETFTYQVTDDDGDTDTATVTITINGDNEPPVINEDPEVSDLSARVSEEGLDDGIADTDPGAPADTTDSDTATGQIIFSDADTTDTHLVSLTAPAEVLTSNGNTIIWDDTDPHTLIGSADGETIITITIDNAGNYSVDLDGRIDHGDNTAEDVESFGVTVTVDDQNGGIDTATLTIGIEDDKPLVSDDTGSIGEDDGATDIITISPAVFGADGPADTDSVSVITDVDQGTLTYDPDTGTFSYDPGDEFIHLAHGESEDVSFTYQVTDDDGDTDTATVTITINGDNEPPVINEDPEVSDLSARVSEEGLDDGIADTDPGAPADTTDSDTATGQIIFSDADTTDTHLVSLTAPAEVLTSDGNAITWDDTDPHTLIGSADGETIITITIDNTGNYSVDLDGRIDHGDNTAEDVESFGVTVTVDDQNGGIDTATLTIGIEDDKPVVSDDTASIGEDDGATEIITISPAVFGADGPADTDSVSVVTDVDQGTLTYDPDTGTFSYDPGDAYNYLSAGETATETFTYQVTDDDGDTDTATVTITINGDNEPPVINEDPEVSDLSARVSEEGLDDGIADTDPGAPADTTDSDTATGQIIFSDADTTDTHLVSLTAPAEALTSDGNAITWDDTDPHTLIGSADGETIITITIDNAGNYSVDLDGRIDHSDNTAEDVESFGVTVTVDDQNGGIDTATLTIGIEDDKPVVSDDTASIGEDDGATEIITISPAVFGADGPADTDSVSVITDVNQGTLTYDPDTATFSYDPGDEFMHLAHGESEDVSFTYQVTDDDGDTDTATVTITINGDNEPPVINEDPQVSDLSARVSEEGLDDGIADTDPGAPADTTDSDTATGQIIFSDADTTDTHLVSLTAPAEALTSDGNAITWDDTDPHTLIGSADGETIITITIDNAGNYSVDLDGRIDHSDNTAEDVESFGVTVTVDDQNGGIDTATLTIGIEDDKPVVSDDTASIGEDDGATEIITISPAVFGADGPADTDSVSVITDVDQGTLTYDPDTATFSYDPGDEFMHLAHGESEDVSFTYQVTDDDGDTDTATVTITINGDNEPPVINEDPQVSDLSARVSEEGLTDGIADTTPTGDDDTTNLTTANGQIIFSDADTTDTHVVSLTAPAEVLTSNGNTIIWDDTDPHTLIGSADDGEVVRVTIDDQGNYDVTLSARIDHGDDTVEDVESFNVTVTVTDPQGASDTATLTIGIEDDSPDAGDITVSSSEGTVPVADVNLLITLDLSGSMDNIVDYDSDGDGVPEQMTRLAATKLATIDLLNSYDNASNDVAVQIVTFNSGANTIFTNSWASVADAQNYLTGLSDTAGSGSTNYDAALAQAQSAFGITGKITGGINVSYFLSDGVPTSGSGESGPGSSGGDGIGTNEETAWKNFLNANDMTSYALGIGTGATQQALNPIAWDGLDETEMDGIVVTEESQLGAVLENTIGDVIPPSPITGNLLSNSASGADLWADEVDANSATVTSVIYNSITHDLTLATDTVTLDLGDAGEVDIHGDGNYEWRPGSSVDADTSLDIGFTVVDADGDTDTALLTLNIEDHGPIAVDDAYSVGIDSNNIVLVIDTSGSMGRDDNNNGTIPLPLAQAALANLINTYGDTLNSVMLVDFNGEAIVHTSGGQAWMSGADAISQINDLTAGGWTDYDDAIQAVQDNYGTPPPADNTFVYFLSDGIPEDNDGSNPKINITERAAWENFLNDENIDEVYAIGIESSNDADLQTVAWSSDGDHSGNVFPVFSANELSVTLENIAQSVSGNVLGNDSDPDGDPLEVTEVDGIALDGDPSTDDTFDLANGSLTINEDGEFTFIPDANIDILQTFEYTVDDGTGNTDIGEVSIDIDTLIDPDPETV